MRCEAEGHDTQPRRTALHLLSITVLSSPRTVLIDRPLAFGTADTPDEAAEWASCLAKACRLPHGSTSAPQGGGGGSNKRPHITPQQHNLLGPFGGGVAGLGRIAGALRFQTSGLFGIGGAGAGIGAAGEDSGDRAKMLARVLSIAEPSRPKEGKGMSWMHDGAVSRCFECNGQFTVAPLLLLRCPREDCGWW